MNEQISTLLKDNKAARWTALIMISFTMLSAYFFVEMITPLRTLLESHYRWEPASFDFFYNSKYFLILIGFLFISGFILDKYGIRLSGLTAIVVMIGGAWLKIYALSPTFTNSGFVHSIVSTIFPSLPPTFVIASAGYAIFGLGVEMTGITISKAIVKWFRGKELALALGIQIASARFGSAIAFFLSANFADKREVFGLIHGNMMNPLYYGVSLLAIGFLTFITFTLMDSKLDFQIKYESNNPVLPKFNYKDLSKIFLNKSLIYISLIWALTYSGIQTFTKYFINILKTETNITPKIGERLFGILIAGTIIFIPLAGAFIDKKGNALMMIIFGSFFLILSYLLIALFPGVSSMFILAGILLLAAYTFIPVASLPIVTKIVDENILGTSFAVFFWIQTIFLMLIPLISGIILDYANPGITQRIVEGDITAQYNYTYPLLFFVFIGVLNIIFGLLLRSEDKIKGYGLNK